MRSIFRGKRAEITVDTVVRILLGFLLAVYLGYGLLAGGAFRWLRPHDPPYNYPGSTWESEDPYISLQVVDKIPEHANAYIVVDGEKRSVIIYMDDQSGFVDIRDAHTRKLLLKGAVKATSERVSIEVVKDLDYLYDGEYPVITLYRTDGQ